MPDVLDPGVDLVAVTGAHLKAEIADLKGWGRAADLARLMAAKAMPAPHTVPRTFVLEPNDSAGADAMATGLLRQLVTVRLLVVLALYRANDPTGAASLVQLDVLKPLIMAALVGFEPGGVCTPFEHERRGLVSSVGSPLVVYQHAVRTTWHIRKH